MTRLWLTIATSLTALYLITGLLIVAAMALSAYTMERIGSR